MIPRLDKLGSMTRLPYREALGTNTISKGYQLRSPKRQFSLPY